MSNLFGGLFEAAQKAKKEKARQAKEAEKAKKRAEEEKLKKQAQKALNATESNKNKEVESKSSKRKREDDSNDEEDSVEMPPIKKSKLSEISDSNASSSNLKKFMDRKKDAKKRKQASSSESSESEKEYDSDASVLEFGDDSEEENEALVSDIQNIISGGQFPEGEEPSDDEDSKTQPSQKQKGDEENTDQQVHAIFIGNLPPTVSKDEITTLVDKISKSINCRVLMQNRDGRNTAVSFIDLKTAKEAKKVVMKLNGKEFKGKVLQVRLANDRKLAPAPVNGESVYIRNLAFTTSEETLRKIFEPCGEIIQIRLPIFEDSGKHRGYGFVDFKDKKGVKNALELNRTEVDGRQILLEAAKVREAVKVESVKNDWSGQHLKFDD